MERREEENEAAFAEFKLERQKEALRLIAGRRRHEEREILSAAFSKWVRVTQFFDAEESAAKNSSNSKELSEIRQKWQAREIELASMQEELDTLRREFEEKTRMSEEAETKLADKISKVEREKAKLAQEREELSAEREQMKSEREAMATLDRFLHRRGRELDEREKSARQGGNGHAYSLYEQRSSKVLEDSLAEERKLMEETAAMLAQREANLRERENALNDQEKELQAKKQGNFLSACEVLETVMPFRSYSVAVFVRIGANLV